MCIVVRRRHFQTLPGAGRSDIIINTTRVQNDSRRDNHSLSAPLQKEGLSADEELL